MQKINVGSLVIGIIMILVTLAVFIFVIYRYRTLIQNSDEIIGQTGPIGPAPTCFGTSASNFSFTNGNLGLITANTDLTVQTNEIIYFFGNTDSIYVQLKNDYPPGVVLYIVNLDLVDHYLCNICEDGSSACNITCTLYWKDRFDSDTFTLSSNVSYHITFFNQQLLMERKTLFLPPA